jgi:hypothetical protein
MRPRRALSVAAPPPAGTLSRRSTSRGGMCRLRQRPLSIHVVARSLPPPPPPRSSSLIPPSPLPSRWPCRLAPPFSVTMPAQPRQHGPELWPPLLLRAGGGGLLARIYDDILTAAAPWTSGEGGERARHSAGSGRGPSGRLRRRAGPARKTNRRAGPGPPVQHDAEPGPTLKATGPA